jgi:5-methylcytosine-specific restriction endonuclease McrA
MTTKISSKLAALVLLRAGRRCEYCQAPQTVIGQTFHHEHILPLSASGRTTAENLCYSCPHCNLAKGNRVSGFDPKTKRHVRLFNPRLDVWEEHFRWSKNGRKVIGTTPIGRATVITLNMNDKLLQEARPLWHFLGRLP